MKWVGGLGGCFFGTCLNLGCLVGKLEQNVMFGLPVSLDFNNFAGKLMKFSCFL